MGVLVAQNHPSVSAFPDSTIASACTSSFSRFARRLLALRPAHSRSHQIRDRYPRASDISSPPCLPRLLPAGAIAGWALHPLEKRRLVTAHVVFGPSLPPVGGFLPLAASIHDGGGQFAGRIATRVDPGRDAVEQRQNGSNGPLIVRRRKLFALLGGTALAWPLEMRAQEPGRTYRIGVLTQNPRVSALYDELSRLGFVEGQNLQVTRFILPAGLDWRPEQFAQHAVELVKAKVDVILAFGNPAIRAAQQATATIPIL